MRSTSVTLPFPNFPTKRKIKKGKTPLTAAQARNKNEADFNEMLKSKNIDKEKKNVEEEADENLQKIKEKEPENRDNVLLLFSGGFDSTATLFYLLQETDYEVHALHLNFASKLGQIEYNGCKEIVKYCKKHMRPFKYFERSMDQFTTNVGMNITREESAKWCNEKSKSGINYKYLVYGRCKVDLRGNFKARAEAAEKIFYRYLNSKLRDKVKFFYPLLQWDKVRIVKYIPPQIIGCVWTCQRPTLTNKRIPQKQLKIIQTACQRSKQGPVGVTTQQRESKTHSTVMVPDPAGGYKIVRSATKTRTAPVRARKPHEEPTKNRSSLELRKKQAVTHRERVYKTINFKPCKACSSCKDIIALIRKYPEIKELHENFLRYNV
jgi:hypothetical protein